MKKMTEQELEQFVHAALRSLPDRKAPGTLEARVLAAVEHQAAMPWWHKGWSYWPAAVRGIFLALATAVGGGVLLGAYAVFAGPGASSVTAGVVDRLSGVSDALAVFGWVVDLGHSIIASIPPVWLYGGLALVAVLYASVFGLGAVAYRTLYRSN